MKIICTVKDDRNKLTSIQGAIIRIRKTKSENP